MQLMEVGNRIPYMELAFGRAWNLLQRRAAKKWGDGSSTAPWWCRDFVYLTWGRWQSRCRYFWGRSWRSPPSSLCRRAAAALHQTRNICSQTRSVCSACLPRSRPSSIRAASSRRTRRAALRRQFVRLFVCINHRGSWRWRWCCFELLLGRWCSRRRASWLGANQRRERWCNAHARMPASGPLRRARGCARHQAEAASCSPSLPAIRLQYSWMP